MKFSDSVVKRLMLARFFFNHAAEHARSHREVSSFAAINQLQDAVETFLFAAAEHLNARIERRTEFNGYLDKIDEKIAPKELPLRVALIRLNKARVNSKHDAIKPHDDELLRFIIIAREFFEEASKLIFGVDFYTISLLNRLDEGEAKDLLYEAEAAFESGSYGPCLILCRKAFFLAFEAGYNISMFRDGDPGPLTTFGCKAPFYTRSKEYINENVREPFDFIARDHTRIDAELATDGIDTR